MKKWLLVLLLLPCAVGANDLFVLEYSKTYTTADTLATTAVRDTTTSSVFDLRDYCTMAFYWLLSPGATQTAGSHANDSLALVLQTSYRKEFTTILRSYVIDQSTAPHAADSGYGAPVPSCRDSVVGDWGRLILINKDSTGASAWETDSIGIIRAYNVTLWIMGRD